jgi:hypothetical protein
METGFGSHTKLHKACDDLRLDVYFKAENIEEASHGLLVLSKVKMQENSLGENKQCFFDVHHVNYTAEFKERTSKVNAS